MHIILLILFLFSSVVQLYGADTDPKREIALLKNTKDMFAGYKSTAGTEMLTQFVSDNLPEIAATAVVATGIGASWYTKEIKYVINGAAFGVGGYVLYKFFTAEPGETKAEAIARISKKTVEELKQQHELYEQNLLKLYEEHQKQRDANFNVISSKITSHATDIHNIKEKTEELAHKMSQFTTSMTTIVTSNKNLHEIYDRTQEQIQNLTNETENLIIQQNSAHDQAKKTALLSQEALNTSNSLVTALNGTSNQATIVFEKKKHTEVLLRALLGSNSENHINNSNTMPATLLNPIKNN